MNFTSKYLFQMNNYDIANKYFVLMNIISKYLF